MLGDAGIARQVSEAMLGINDRLEESVALVRENCSPEEASRFGMAVGRVINMIFEGVLDPLYERHPALKPPDLE